MKYLILLFVLVLVGVGGLWVWRTFTNYLRTGVVKQTFRDAYDRVVPERQLGASQVQRSIFRSMIAANKIGVRSNVLRPDGYEVFLSDDDYAAVADLVVVVQQDLASSIDREAKKEGWTTGGPAVVTIAVDHLLRNGRPDVRTRFGSAAAAELGSRESSAQHGVARTVPIAVPDRTVPFGSSDRTVPLDSPSFVGVDSLDGLVIRPRAGATSFMLGRAHQPELERFPLVSGDHCRVERTAEGWKVVDLSSNGTLLDGEKVADAVLRSGQVVRLSPAGPRLRFVVSAAAGS